MKAEKKKKRKNSTSRMDFGDRQPDGVMQANKEPLLLSINYNRTGIDREVP